MNEDERKTAAGDLIAAVKHNRNSAYDTWLTLEKGDWDGHAAWVQKALGLASPPSREDLQAMHDHSVENLKDKIHELKDMKPRAPVVGQFCGADQT